MAPSARVRNKRTLKYQIIQLGNTSDKIAFVAQDYADGGYPLHAKAFQTIFLLLEQVKDVLTKLEAMI